MMAVVFLLGGPRCSLAQSQTPGLVAAYSFNEGAGSVVNDASGNNLTGTIVGATWTTSGRYGNALSFNGSSSYVDLGNPAALQLTGDMTLEAWVKAGANPSDDGQILAKSNGTGWQFKTSPDTGPETFGVSVSGTSTTSTQRYSTTARSLNVWYHVAAVYNAAAGTLDIYVNGNLDDGTLRGTVPSTRFNPNVNVNIGRRTGGYYFNGIIDEVRIYNRTLSQSEIQTDMITPIAGTPPPPDTIPPTVSIISPPDGATVAGTAAISASASDNVGIAGVQFLLDGARLGSEVVNPPYTLQWNTATTSLGTHSVSAVARDLSGNTTASTNISLTVVSPTPAQVGQWSGVMNWPIVAVHAILLPTGDVLAWTDYTINEGAQVWRPSTNSFTPRPEPDVSLFCAGNILMADGRVLVVGGIVGLQDDLGPRNSTIFDPTTQSWSQGALMVTGRYYPTATVLPDGRVLVMGGTTTCNSCIADMPEIFDPVANTWTQLVASARMAFKYYPHSFVLPDGRVLVSSQDDQAISSRVLDLTTQTWTTVDAGVFDGHSSVMYLPGKIMKAGTATADNPGLPSAPTTYVLDMAQTPPVWSSTASMANPRSYLNLTILPDGQVLATGGSTTTDKANFAAAVYPAELWSPVTKTWTSMSSMQTPRLYHSTALLLPDATVLVAGGGRENGRSQPDPNDEPNAEIFSPPYLFKGPRPVISSAPSLIQYGSSFSVLTPDASRVAAASLIALGAVTHAFNENQRFVPLTFGPMSGGINVHAPVDGNAAPPGPYMLFLVDNTGVPSVASMVRVIAAGAGPTPSITSLSAGSGVVGSSLTITGTNFGTPQGGSTVTFNGASAGVAGSWSATSITVQVPGNATSGNIVVTVGNVASNGINFSVIPAVTGGGALVQHASKDAGTSKSSTLAFTSSNTAGNWIGVVVRAAPTGQLFAVTDTRGNTYHKAVQLNETVDGTTVAIYYAENIVGGTNTVSVSDTTLGTLRIAILEYAGIAAANSLDGVPAAAQGTSAAPSSGNTTTSASGDLLLGAMSTANGESIAAGSGYAIRESVPAAPNTKLVVEEQIQAAAGTTLANATLGASDNWGAVVAAFKAGTAGGGNPPPSPPSISILSATSGVVGSTVTISGANFGASQGGSTVTFNGVSAGLASSWTAASITVQVPGNATSGNVVVTVGNVASNGINFTVTTPLTGSVALVQHASKDAGSTKSSTLAFPVSNTAGNWIGVVVRAAKSGQLFTVTDTIGNIYRKAVQLNETADGTTIAIYYAENIAGGTNTVSVSDAILGPLRIAILEYAGVATANSLDGVPAAAQGTSAAPSSGNMATATTANGDLLLGAISTANAANITAGSGYVTRESVPGEPSTKLMVEEQIQAAAGTTLANATLGARDNWGAVLAAFKAVASSGTTVANFMNH